MEVSPAMRAPPSVAATSPVAASAPPPSSAVDDATGVGVPPEAALVHPRPGAGHREHRRAHDEEPGVRDRAAGEQEGRGDRAAPGPAGERRRRRDERGGEDQVRHVAAAQERRPGAGQHAGGKPSAPRQGAPASAGEGNGGQPDRGAERVLQTAEPRDETLIQRAGHRGDQGRRAGALARQREPARHRHPRPPQVDGHVGADGERIHVAQGRP